MPVCSRIRGNDCGGVVDIFAFVNCYFKLETAYETDPEKRERKERKRKQKKREKKWLLKMHSIQLSCLCLVPTAAHIDGHDKTKINN